MTAARTNARNILMARGFTEAQAVALLLPVVGEAYREVASEAAEAAQLPNVWGDTPSEALRAFGAAFTKTADDIDPRPAPSDQGSGE